MTHLMLLKYPSKASRHHPNDGSSSTCRNDLAVPIESVPPRPEMGHRAEGPLRAPAENARVSPFLLLCHTLPTCESKNSLAGEYV